MQSDGERERGEITACYPGLKLISTVWVSTFEVKTSLKWVFRHPQMKPTDSADLYKLLSAVEGEGRGGLGQRWRKAPWLKFSLIETFRFFLGVELNSREGKLKRRSRFCFDLLVSSRPPQHTSPIFFAMCLCSNLGCCNCVSGREGVIWSSRSFFFFFQFLPSPLHCAIKFNDTSVCLNRLK